MRIYKWRSRCGVENVLAISLSGVSLALWSARRTDWRIFTLGRAQLG